MKGYKFLYGLAQRMLSLTIRLLSPFHKKAGKMLEGRKHSLRIVKDFRIRHPHEKIYWFHAASVGEFEQALPIMRLLKESEPEVCLAISFFSPSGMEQKGNHPLADLSFYLPGDLRQETDALTIGLKPAALIIIKYEFWYNLLSSCKRQQIPVLSVSCILRPAQWENPWLRLHLSQCLPLFHHFFVQNEETASMLEKLGLKNYSLSGDTRIDRVLEIRESGEELNWLRDWKGSSKLLIIGSAWPEDLEFLREFIAQVNNDPTGTWKILLVPHEISEASLQQADKILGMKLPRFSHGEPEKDSRLLLLDRTGFLSRAYRHADAAWIGGAFRTGLHNILEAAVFGIPVSFGPNYAKFQEACDLIQAGVATSFPATGSFNEYFEEINSAEKADQIRQSAGSYFQSRKGSAGEIACYLIGLKD